MADSNVIHVDFRRKCRVESVNDPIVEPVLPADIETHAKALLFEELIARGKTSVHALTNAPGVQIPEHLRSSQTVVIDWSTRFGMMDFDFDEEGVRGTLSFAQQPFYVVLPWTAVFKIHLAAHPKEGREWVPAGMQPAQTTTQIFVATPAQLAALLGNLPSPPAQTKPVIESVEELKNEPTLKDPPGVAPGAVKRVFGAVRKGFESVFGK